MSCQFQDLIIKNQIKISIIKQIRQIIIIIVYNVWQMNKIYQIVQTQFAIQIYKIWMNKIIVIKDNVKQQIIAVHNNIHKNGINQI